MANTQSEQRKSKPIAVVISDIHFNLNTLDVASACTLQAVKLANELEVPLISAGDAHDSKANLRGECVNAMIDIFAQCDQKPFLLVGNHSRLNEKSKEHSINFLAPYGHIINDPVYEPMFDAYFIPYQHDPEAMRAILAQIPTGARLIIHQGRAGTEPGIGSFDKTALPAHVYAPFKVISGHYHEHQSFGEGFTYVGNPYTLDFSEANHPAKGFLVLNDDFSFERVLTNQRKHVVLNLPGHLPTLPYVTAEDIVLVKSTGTKFELAKINKDTIRQALGLQGNFRLDLIATDAEMAAVKVVPNQTVEELFNLTVDAKVDLSPADKDKVKELWREHK